MSNGTTFRSSVSETRLPSSNASREERKYPVPHSRIALISAWLDARLPRDPRYPDGVITSCYYDTPQLDDYWSAADGDFAKQKLRLRWYGDPIDRYGGVWLEIKSRDGARSGKWRQRYPLSDLDVTGTNPLGVTLPSQAELAPLLREAVAETGASLPPTLRPTALIRYQRTRWQSRDGALRASLDSEIRIASPNAPQLWLPLVGDAVLELKSDGELPPQIAHLARLGLRRSAHSKYALAIERLHGTRTR